MVLVFCRKKKQYLKIQRIHQKAPKVVYNSDRNYDELLRNNYEINMWFNMWSFQIFRRSKSRIFVVVLCFQKHNLQYKKRSFAEITWCKMDFLWHKFSVIYPVDTGRKLDVHKTFVLLRSLNVLCLRGSVCLLCNSLPQSAKHSESNLYVTPCEYNNLWLFWCQCGMLNCK